MSWYLANEDGIIDQFASVMGLHDLREAAVEHGTPALKSFLTHGATNAPLACIVGLSAVAKATNDESVKSTCARLEQLLHGETLVSITQGFGEDGEDDDDDSPKKKAETLKRASIETIRIDPNDDSDSQMARNAMRASVSAFLREQAPVAASRVKALLRASSGGALSKGNEDKPLQIAQAATDAIPWHDLVYPVEQQIYEAALAGLRKGYDQIGVTDRAGIVTAQKLAREFAQDRAAELVGMKWVDGELIENPNAKWAISDSTRDMIRRAVEDAFAGETKISDLADTIADSGAFSDSRADMIAKTEVARAQSEGTLAAWKQTGAVLARKWVLSSIHPCCDECDENAAAGSVPIDEPFPSGDHTVPAHPNCICAVVATSVKGY